jgi:ABC-type polysaccharide/polyol phosphate transport system ATPase subunit
VDAIVAHGITKTYRVGIGRARVREMIPWPADAALRRLLPRWWLRNTFNALEDVTFSAPAGSALGIVGHNGAGKTTLLKVIAGITSPAAGTMNVTGRIGALIDLLAGSHPELTGRENVYLLGAIHGFSRRDMAARVQPILEFAEIEDFADTPLKRYSAGMAARLGFATITAIGVDILLVDEVLAVGDASFQRKCIGWLDEYRANGGTLVFVSHNLGLIRNMTERVVWIDHGRVVSEGPTGEILAEYARAMERRVEVEDVSAHTRRDARKQMLTRGLHRWGAGGARVDEVHFPETKSDDGALDVAISYESSELDQALFCIGFVDESGSQIGAAASPPLRLEAGRGSVTCSIPHVPLHDGIYFPVVAILSLDGQVRDRWRLDRALVVEHDGVAKVLATFGPVEIASTWQEA